MTQRIPIFYIRGADGPFVKRRDTGITKLELSERPLPAIRWRPSRANAPVLLLCHCQDVFNWYIETIAKVSESTEPYAVPYSLDLKSRLGAFVQAASGHEWPKRGRARGLMVSYLPGGRMQSVREGGSNVGVERLSPEPPPRIRSVDMQK